MIYQQVVGILGMMHQPTESNIEVVIELYNIVQGQKAASQTYHGSDTYFRDAAFVIPCEPIALIVSCSLAGIPGF